MPPRRGASLFVHLALPEQSIYFPLHPRKHAGYTLDELLLNGETKKPIAGTYAFNMPANNVVVDATFKPTGAIIVNSITVTGEDGNLTIDTDGGTLQMIAEVLPEDASNKNITWSVQLSLPPALLLIATINQDGLLIATGNGTVTVTVTAKDGSGVYGTIDITISNQHEEPSFTITSTFKVGSVYPATELAPDELLVANVSVTNNQDTAQQVLLIVALYNSNGAMENVSFISKNIMAGQNDSLTPALNFLQT